MPPKAAASNDLGMVKALTDRLEELDATAAEFQVMVYEGGEELRVRAHRIVADAELGERRERGGGERGDGGDPIELIRREIQHLQIFKREARRDAAAAAAVDVAHGLAELRRRPQLRRGA